MATVPASGVEPGQRQLNGPQNTGRDYRDLSSPTFRMRRENDVRITLRDDTVLLADLYRPISGGRDGFAGSSVYAVARDVVPPLGGSRK